MIDLQGLIDKMEDEGYEGYLAEARVCQDLILRAIAGSTLNRNVTIKGGVVMRGITGSARRATQDLDLDFIRYSLDDDSIRRFIGKLNCIEGSICSSRNSRTAFLCVIMTAWTSRVMKTASANC